MRITGILIPILLSILSWTSCAFAYETKATAALLIDQNSGTELLNINADKAIPPASMSKLMTVLLVFEALDKGKITMDTQFSISKKAWKKGGSKMFLREGSNVSVENLLQGVIIQSGNDACIALAEGISGSEDAFVSQMNIRAKQLGLTQSSFGNSTGWPDPRQRMSARDLVTLATRLINKHPKYYKYFSQENFTWDKIKQDNRNPLLYQNIGADGLKTGHTKEAGYGLVGSAVRDGRRITFMITGFTSERERKDEGRRLVDWAFNEFKEQTLYKAGDVISGADVWIGKKSRVPLTSSKNLTIILPKSSQNNIEMSVSYDGPIEAPIEKGQPIAKLIIKVPNMVPVEHDLVAGEAVAKGGIFRRMQASLKSLTTKTVKKIIPQGE